MKLRKSVSDPYLDALVEYYKDGNYYKLNEGHANHIGSVGTENFDPPDDDCPDGDTGSNNSSITTQLLTKSSTCMHEKEPFDACRCKVNQLCIDISLGAPSTIDRTNGGSYNRAEITIWLQRFAFLRVHKALAIDTAAANSLKSPYVLQERLQGIPLDDLLFEVPEQLSMSTRLEVVKNIAEFTIKSEKTTLDKLGILVGTHTGPWTSISIASSTPRIEFVGFYLDFVETAPPPEKQDLPSLLSTMIKAQQTNRTQEDARWEMLLIVLGKMSAKHFFKSSDSINVLWHWDLQPRHIFVEKSEAGKWEVSGVVDWDDVNSMPLVLTRAPRSWLWFNEEHFEYRNNCEFPWDGDYDAPLDLPLDKDITIVEEYFDRIMQEADPTYMNDTYGRGLWIRRVTRSARDGSHNCWDFERCDKFIEGWNNQIGDVGSIYGESFISYIA